MEFSFYVFARLLLIRIFIVRHECSFDLSKDKAPTGR
jgi:hypothetical protein